MQDQRKPDTRTPEQRKQDHEAAQRAFNEMVQSPPNRVTATRLTTRQEMNDAIRRAAGRDTPEDAA